MKIKKLALIGMTCMMMTSMVGCSSAPEEDAKEEKKEFYALNETITLDDHTLIVTGVEKLAGEGYNKPKEGNEYVIVNVSIENTGEGTVTYNPFDFKMQNSQGQIESSSFTSINVDTALNSGELAKGGKIEGTIPFEQPTGDSDLTLIYKNTLFSEDDIKIKLQ